MPVSPVAVLLLGVAALLAPGWAAAQVTISYGGSYYAISTLAGCPGPNLEDLGMTFWWNSSDAAYEACMLVQGQLGFPNNGLGPIFLWDANTYPGSYWNNSTCVNGTNDASAFATFALSQVATPSPSPGASPNPPPSASPSASPEPSPSASPSATPSASPEPSPGASPEPSTSASPEPSPSASPEPSPSASPEPSPSASPSVSPNASPEPSPSASLEPSPSASPEPSPSAAPSPSPSPLDCSLAVFDPPIISSRLNGQVCSGNKAVRMGKQTPFVTNVSLSLVDANNQPAAITITDILTNRATAGWQCRCRPTKRDNCTCLPNAVLLGGGGFFVLPQWRRSTLPGNVVDTTLQVSFTAVAGDGGTCSGTAAICSAWGVRTNRPLPVCSPFNSTGVTRPALTCT